MLSSETKRRIDSCRDILVGQLPLPTDQVELITLALIYKFMDDLDEQSVQLGGKRSFFIKDLADFRWRSLMPQTVSAADRVRLFADGLEALGDPKTGKHLPEMFRDIFRNAMLKFRDGRILSLFLAELDGFAYSHSEELGNAFEYLLQSMGAQGDNGQFRTPRHIIDFIVEVLEPKPEDKILDPACGTGGFLVSAYKHILGKQTSKGSSVPGDQLSPAKKEKLTQHLNGYDITPMMVKLSKVNMFLHGFSDPQIHEYDTLSNDARWNEKYDLIMANPPFMTPKGGVVPHTKFRIAAKKAEVLFTDYIAEHLSTNGRAGIIVPEGIIFQSATAYKALRKFLVEDSLVAVISLPAGVFNPYSGVKTSILILDKGLARQTDSIAFFKVENDGYDLGAQRRPLDKNDLPKLIKETHEYLEKLRAGKKASETENMQIVPKEKIAANGEYNLGGERYREIDVGSLAYPSMSLGDLCELIGGGTPSKEQNHFWENGSIKWISSKHIDLKGKITGNELITVKAVEESSTRIAPKGSTIIITRVSVGKFAEADDEYAINQDLTALVSKNPNQLDPKFIGVVARQIARTVERNAEGIGVRGVTRNFLSELQIPLPPLEIQKEIVAEIEGYQKVIDGARAVVENYKPQIPIDPKWPVVELGEACTVQTGGTPSRSNETYWNGNIPWVGSTVCKDCKVTQAEEFISEAGLENSSAKKFPSKTTLIALVGATIGKTAQLEFECTTNQNVAGLIPSDNKKLSADYLFYAVQGLYPEFLKLGEDQFRMANLSFVRTCKIPIPPPPTQEAILIELKTEQAMVDANKDLIARFEKKIQAVIDRVWGGGTAE
jgi:type I restriction enzyme M protein